VIRVSLGRTPVDLDGPSSRGGAESATAIAFFGDPANADGEFSFAAYRLETVKAALNEAFHFKCAYCESDFSSTGPVDVEHFRPKSGFVVDGALRKPGYYWLAAAWGNLLPSCIDCNRQRRQTLSTGEILVSGKANQFPLSSEAKRARSPGEEKNESRLLLHPALDRPERHLTFDREEGIVAPTVTGSGASRKGRTSIAVYALLRDRLVRARKEHQKRIRRELAIARGLAKRIDEAGPDPELEALLEETLTGLRDAMAPSAEYSLMARQLIEPEIAQLIG
jgi:uncharacterized protein (TIGR02646 family)